MYFSDLKGKIAVDLASSDSPVRNLLTRQNSVSNGLSLKIKTSEINGNLNFQRSFSRTGPVSPGAESAFSMDEVMLFIVPQLYRFHASPVFCVQMSTTLPFFRAPMRPVITDTRLHWLWPPPKQLQQLNGLPFSLHQPWNISFVSCSIPLHE